MSKITQGVRVSTSELPAAERRRRLASVYRLLIELGQRSKPVGEQEAKQELTGEQLEKNPVKDTDSPSL